MPRGPKIKPGACGGGVTEGGGRSISGRARIERVGKRRRRRRLRRERIHRLTVMPVGGRRLQRRRASRVWSDGAAGSPAKVDASSVRHGGGDVGDGGVAAGADAVGEGHIGGGLDRFHLAEGIFLVREARACQHSAGGDRREDDQDGTGGGRGRGDGVRGARSGGPCADGCARRSVWFDARKGAYRCQAE